MELCEKGNLREVLKILRSEQQIEWPLLLRLATDIAKGLSYLHENNLIHRYNNYSNNK